MKNNNPQKCCKKHLECFLQHFFIFVNQQDQKKGRKNKLFLKLKGWHITCIYVLAYIVKEGGYLKVANHEAVEKLKR